MSQIFTHTFTFETQNSEDKNRRLDNIISITNERNHKYRIEYLQYSIGKVPSNKEIVHYRHVGLIVDRLYFLEIANITLDDELRRERFFTFLGKRRLGANNNRIDPYLLNTMHDHKTIYKAFTSYKKEHAPETYYYKSSNAAENHYKMIPFKSNIGYFVLLKQQNVSPRRSFKKLFLLELLVSDFTYFDRLTSTEEKVEFFFNKLGKTHFKSLPLNIVDYNDHSDITTLLHGCDVSTTHNDDLSENRLFNYLNEKIDLITRLSTSVIDSTFMMLEDANKSTIEDFSTACTAYTMIIKDVQQLNEISSYITTFINFAQEGKLSYLLQKNDSDLKDIFLYTMELFSHWSTLIIQKYSDVKLLERQTSDLSNAFKYLVETFLEFTHLYQINDATHRQDTLQTNDELFTPKRTSAQEFFSETELDVEVIDELNELELEISTFSKTSQFDENLKANLILFFDGYARMLSSFYEFKDLGYSLIILSTKIRSYDTAHENKFLSIILFAIVEDLIGWKQEVLIAKTAEWIHYMDSSFYSNIAQMEILLNEDETEEDSELELF